MLPIKLILLHFHCDILDGWELHNVKALREEQQQLVTADLNSFNTTEDRSLGAELVANNEWNRLHFDNILKKCKFDDKEISLAKT